MEELIKKFLSGYGYGDGDGYGDGSGSGYGSGDGDGDGDGDGYGSGSGDGDGDGSGSGSGYGYGDGYGDGDGSGSGYGYGSGSGSGDGDGSGYGYGDGDGSGLKIKTFHGEPVYYIDGIPCTFARVHSSLSFAKVNVINKIDLTAEPQYVVKYNGVFAHGLTIKQAKIEAENKYYSSLDTESTIAAFRETFKKGKKYAAQLFYDWHSRLTGSCTPGKDLFVKQHNIDLDAEMTVEQFISITKDAYGGNVIRQLLES
jgi:hypothetical protein